MTTDPHAPAVAPASTSASASASAIERLQAMVADACFGKPEASDLNDNLGAYLARHGVAEEDARAMLASPRRLGLYRHLLRHNVFSVIELLLCQTRLRFERFAPQAFERAIDDFLAEKGPKTPHLRDVPAEFLAWAAPRWREGVRVPAWLVDAAEFEMSLFAVGMAPQVASAALPFELGELALDRALVFAWPYTLVSFETAVHKLPESDPNAVPEHERVHLLLYRDASHAVDVLELTALLSKILAFLFESFSLEAAMTAGCAAIKVPLDDAVLAETARLLADLGERGILLGAKAVALAPGGSAPR